MARSGSLTVEALMPGVSGCLWQVLTQPEGLADLERFFETIGKNESHKQWGKDLEPHVVSGSAVWSIYRVL
jgi:hypothetical protein